MKHFMATYMYQRENGDYGWKNVPASANTMNAETFDWLVKKLREQEGTENIVIISIIPLED